MAPPETPAPEWWFGPGAPFSHSAMVRAVGERLKDAVARFGYPNGPEARRALGEETWAAIERFAGSWAELCEFSDEDNFRRVIPDIAGHLYRVRNGGAAPIADSTKNRGEDAAFFSRQESGSILANIFKDSPYSFQGKDVITGENLAIVLATILEGDAEMTPIMECKKIHIERTKAEEVAKECLDQWRTNKDIKKSMFKSILVRRLMAAQERKGFW